MNAEPLSELLRSADYEFTDLGDGTGVLASLDRGKMITLNELAASVVKALLAVEACDAESALQRLTERNVEAHGVAHDRVATDVHDFVITLTAQLRGDPG